MGTDYHHAEEDFIDMEVSSSSNLFYYSTISSPPHSREFEFQMCPSISQNYRKTTISPADELFYKGKLLPLHLPPRLQMVQNLLHNSTINHFQEDNNTPFDQFCNISPSKSCRVSSELDPDEYFEWSAELRGFINGDDHHPKDSWSKKKFRLMIKQSSLSQKLKSSRTYLKSLFAKSGCSNESSAKASCNVERQTRKGATFPKLANVMNNMTGKDGFEGSFGRSHRKSFSGAMMIKKCPKMKCSSSSLSPSISSSSSSSFNSSGFYELQMLKRRVSENSEIDGSIEAAIAYCKKVSAAN